MWSPGDAEAPAYAEVQSGPYRLGLRRGERAGPAPDAEFTLFVGDLDAAHARLRAGGADPTPPEVQPWGGRMFTCTDPDGHVWSHLEYAPAAGGDEA